MVNLVVDVGNTRIKVAAVEGVDVHRLVVREEWCDQMERDVCDVVDQFGVELAIISSTRGDQSEIVAHLERLVRKVVIFTVTPVPIDIGYDTPQTLGRDRVAAAVGANEVYGVVEDRLIIDLGSAITIDLCTKEGGFEGGFISPGVSMRFKALNEYTASLPLCKVEQSGVEKMIARSTDDAIIGGVMKGVIYEIEGHIAEFRAKMCEISIIFIGGDAKYFDKRIKNAIFAEHDLVIVGLNRILRYNVK